MITGLEHLGRIMVYVVINGLKRFSITGSVAIFERYLATFGEYHD